MHKQQRRERTRRDEGNTNELFISYHNTPFFQAKSGGFMLMSADYVQAVKDIIEARGATSGEIRESCFNCQKGQGQDKTLGINLDTGAFNCFRCPVQGNFLKINGSEKQLLAEYIWNHALSKKTHPYPTKKQIHPEEIRVDKYDNWVVPFHDSAGQIQTVQLIDPDGKKKVLSKAKNNGQGVTGSAYKIVGDNATVYVCEGPATGHSNHEATGATVYCVGGKENFKHVLPWVKEKHKTVIVAADNDSSGAGLKAANKAAVKNGLKIVIPPTVGMDFNDYSIAAGLDAVKTVLENPRQPGGQPDALTPKGITASALMRKVFPEPKWAVEGILPEGLNILGGKPKGGKSIMSMNLCLSISLGGVAFQSIKVKKGTTIYLALEDTQRRLQKRLNQMLKFDPAPENLHLFTEWPRLGEGGAKALDQILADNPDTRLLVIDTLAKIRPPQKSNGNIYADDYQVIGALKEIADRHEVSILVVHHLRKMESADVFDTFSGSLGLTGAADGLMVLRRNEIGQNIFSLRGRDVEEQEFVLELDPVMMSWKITGKPVDIKSTPERQKLYDCLKDAEGPLSPKEIEDQTGLRGHYIRKTLPTLLEEGTIQKQGRGKYIFIENNNKNHGNNGNNGNNQEQWEQWEQSEIDDDYSSELFPDSTTEDKAGNNCKAANDKAFGDFVPNVPIVPDIPTLQELDDSDEVTI